MMMTTGMLTIAVEEVLAGVEMVCPEIILKMAGSMVCYATYLLAQASQELLRLECYTPQAPL